MFKMPQEKHAVVISPSIVVFTLLLIGLVYFLFLIHPVIILLFLSFIIMTALRPVVERMHRQTKIPKIFCIFLTYVSLIAFISLLVAIIVPPLVIELYNLVKAFNIPYLSDDIMNLKLSVGEIGSLLNSVGSQVGLLFSVVSSTFSGILTAFMLVVISFYLMLDRANLHKKLVWFTRERAHLEIGERFLNSLEEQLGGWVRGQLILMFVMGIVTYFGLSLLGVPYALPLAILAGLLEILPNIGPTISAVPAVILSFIIQGPAMSLVVVLFYVLSQQFENSYLVPKVMQENADVNPLVAILVILTGAQLGGVIGALISVPVYIVLRTAYSFWYSHQST